MPNAFVIAIAADTTEDIPTIFIVGIGIEHMYTIIMAEVTEAAITMVAVGK